MLAGIPGIQEVRLVDLPAARGWERWRGRGARRAIQGLLDVHDLVHLRGVWKTALLRGRQLRLALTPTGF